MAFRRGIARHIWLTMAFVGALSGLFFPTTLIVILTAGCILFFGLIAWLLSPDYGWGAVLPGVTWWAGMFLVPMWLAALVR